MATGYADGCRCNGQPLFAAGADETFGLSSILYHCQLHVIARLCGDGFLPVVRAQVCAHSHAN